MARLSKEKIAWNGLVPELVKLLSTWKPPLLQGELAYRDHLYSFIRQSIPLDSQIEKEYRHLGTTIDLWVHWKGILFNDQVAIEIKVNLKRKTECDRLIGQLEALSPKENSILLVLVGETDQILLGRIQRKYATQSNALIEPQRFAIIQTVPEPYIQ